MARPIRIKYLEQENQAVVKKLIEEARGKMYKSISAAIFKIIMGVVSLIVGVVVLHHRVGVAFFKSGYFRVANIGNFNMQETVRILHAVVTHACGNSNNMSNNVETVWT